MLSNKPYLIRAFYEWIIDSKCTPYLTVNALHPRCKVPQQFVEDGQIVLDISPHAVRDFKVNNDVLEFRASFSTIVHIISVPIKAVLAVYAQENGQGMFFDFEEDNLESESEWNDAAIEQPIQSISTQSDKKRPSHLKLVD